MIQKRLRLILAGCMLLLGLGLLWTVKEKMFQAMFSYRMIDERTRNSGFSKSPLFLGLGSYKYDDSEDVDLVMLIEDALQFTDMRLSFAAKNIRNDPDALLKHGRAHCVGYSAFFKATIEDLLESRHIEDVEVYHVFGEVHFAGINLHRFTSIDFLKDHDYNIVVNRRLGKTYFIDPSLHDILGIGFVRGNIKKT